MKVFSLLKPDSSIIVHPQEDYLLISKKYPIFIVADGVSLKFNEGVKYPEESGAAKVAEIFCSSVISEAEKAYDMWEKKDIRDIFNIANKKVLEYNNAQGRTKDTINYWDFDLFCATTSFLLIKDSKAYWWSLCDSGVIIFRNGANIFKSPDGWMNFPKDWFEVKFDRKKISGRHKNFRNVISDSKLAGYGVVNGEENAVAYLNYGVLDIKNDDVIFLYTDGFESYFSLEEFNSLFKLWPEDMREKLEKLISEKSKIDYKKYGAEKTIVVISGLD